MEIADWDLRNSDIPVQIKCTICLWDEKSQTGRDKRHHVAEYRESRSFAEKTVSERNIFTTFSVN